MTNAPGWYLADCLQAGKRSARWALIFGRPTGLTDRWRGEAMARLGDHLCRTSLAYDSTLRSCCRNQIVKLPDTFLVASSDLPPQHRGSVPYMTCLDLRVTDTPKSTRTPDGQFWYWNHFLLYSVNAEVLPISGGFIIDRPFCTRTRKTEDIKAIRKPQPMKSPTTLVLRLLGTTQQTSPSGSDETSLLTRDSVAVDGGGFTDMLVVTLWRCVRYKSLNRNSVLLTPP